MRRGLLSRAAGAQSRVPSGVALTFDDGPAPGTTDRLLDLLAALEVPATFFCVGRSAQRHPALLRRMHEEGHLVGSHSWSHAAPGAQSGRRLVDDYARGRAAVEDVLGLSVPLFRPPYGALPLRTAAHLRNQETWIWTVDPRDWVEETSVADLLRITLQAGPGDVVLLHDWVENPRSPQAQDRSCTLDAVPEIVRRLRVKGHELVHLSS